MSEERQVIRERVSSCNILCFCYDVSGGPYFHVTYKNNKNNKHKLIFILRDISLNVLELRVSNVNITLSWINITLCFLLLCDILEVWYFHITKLKFSRAILLTWICQGLSLWQQNWGMFFCLYRLQKRCPLPFYLYLFIFLSFLSKMCKEKKEKNV